MCTGEDSLDSSESIWTLLAGRRRRGREGDEGDGETRDTGRGRAARRGGCRVWSPNPDDLNTPSSTSTEVTAHSSFSYYFFVIHLHSSYLRACSLPSTNQPALSGARCCRPHNAAAARQRHSPSAHRPSVNTVLRALFAAIYSIYCSFSSRGQLILVHRPCPCPGPIPVHISRSRTSMPRRPVRCRMLPCIVSLPRQGQSPPLTPFRHA